MPSTTRVWGWLAGGLLLFTRLLHFSCTWFGGNGPEAIAGIVDYR